MMRAISGVVGLLAGAGLLATGVPAATGAALASQQALAGGPGTITTLAGGPGRGPVGTLPQGALSVAVSPGGRVYVGGAGVHAFSPPGRWEAAFAGNGAFGPGFVQNGIPALRAALPTVAGEALDAAGNLLVSDELDARVRVIAAETGTFYGQAMTARHIYTIAGNGSYGYSGDGGPATKARIGSPTGLAVDDAGNVLVSDVNNSVVRVIAAKTGTFYGQAMTAGDIYTLAGTGTPGYSGDGGPGRSAQVGYPEQLALDGAGNVLIADSVNGRVRVVAAKAGTFYGQAMTAGDIYTIAGDGARQDSGDHGPATAAGLRFPQGLAVDGSGNILIGNNRKLRMIAERPGTFYGQTVTAGDIYTLAGIRHLPGLSGGARGLALDPAGNVVIADGPLVRVVAGRTGTFYGQPMVTGHLYTVAGTLGPARDGGLALNALLGGTSGSTVGGPDGIADGPGGGFIVGDSNENQVFAVPHTSGTYYGRAMTAGHIYDVAGNGTSGYSGDGGPGSTAELDTPTGPATDGAGNLLFADTLNYRVRMVADTSGTFFGQAMTAGHIYTIAGNGTGGTSGDGGPATAAELKFPVGVAVDAHGNVVISDFLNAIRVVAAGSGTFYGQAMTAGDIYTIAATQDTYGQPAIDSAGNVIFGGGNAETVQVLAAATGTFYGIAMTAGNIYTIAGNGTEGYAGDGGPALAAEMNFPTGVAVDGAGNVLISDKFNNRVRVVAAATGTFYGQHMKAGDIYTLAGNGKPGFLGDGGPATAAQVDDPESIAVDPAGGVLIADTGSFRVREVSG